MIYVRTEDKILKANTPHLWENHIIKQADTIKELLDTINFDREHHYDAYVRKANNHEYEPYKYTEKEQ